MLDGPRLLRAWLKRSKLRQRDFARLLKISEPHLSKILSGQRCPGTPNCVTIEDLTGVPVRSWVPQPVSVSGKASSQKRTRTHVDKGESRVA